MVSKALAARMTAHPGAKCEASSRETMARTIEAHAALWTPKAETAEVAA